MSEICFIDAGNQLVGYTDDGQNLFQYDGQPLGYVFEDSVYSYSGKHLGWIGLSGIYDRNGYRAFATVHPSQLAMPPFMIMMPPFKSIKSITPIQGVREWKPQRPAVLSDAWSPHVGLAFFKQG